MTANDNDHRGLLPAGLADLLPPDAAREARAIDLAIERFAAFGYERVKPPLVEFEESLLGGPGAALGPQTFRLMDPVSQRMMGVRPDMTVQVARIAVTRLKHEPRPLRLSYGGNVIRVRGSALKPERQFAQVGTELIGVDSAEADAEAVLLAIDALRAIGVADLTVDLNLPTLVAAVAAGLKLPAEPLRRLRRALDRKDEAAVAKALGEKKGAELFVGLLRAAGPADRGIAQLAGLKLPAAGAAEAARLAEVVKLVRAADPDLPLTIDPVEYRGLEYQTGVSFSVFALKGRQELARGGRYSAGYPEDGVSEPATGFTVYMDAVLAASDAAPQRPRLYLPLGVAWREAAPWQAKGYAIVRAVVAVSEPRAEAKRLNCSHALIDGDAVPL
ncbi:MAG: ATP phosphoribosyltransferase regulatory subunit [Reyranella sp.]|uniref:ATP phosphoribosyltransferase regulatory subunit n=1 Tax=Reyranella sp. TaxID=1929291 RepID=UPI00120DCD15|nr:ATP phosphoribosyltransferase regulatory subunit [Reyranella sp.]TAJ38647.1 MAG: ATP phosphoribosyltransferase regulatory subunit [Reyranella sp.]